MFWRALLIGMFALPAGAAEVVTIAPFELHNSFWMSLHQTLIAEADGFADPDLSNLTEEDRETWERAVARYVTEADGGSVHFADAMAITNDFITQIADDARLVHPDTPLAEELIAVASIYREHWWESDSESNEFMIGYAAAMLEEGGDELVGAHERIYGETWPDVVRVYIAPWGGRFGGYTMFGRNGGTITTIGSRDQGNQGFDVLELVLHESSHARVGPRRGAVKDAIDAAASKRGVDPPRDLWHAILFSTTSELTRDYLDERGIEYVPFAEDMFVRVYGRYRDAVWDHWHPYLRRGEGTLESAIDAVVGAIVSEQ